MINLVKVLSVLLQVFLLLSLFSFASGVANAVAAFPTADPKLIAGELSAGIVLSLIQVIPAMVGFALSFWCIKKSTEASKVYLKLCKLFAYLWLLFIPIGIILGIKQLKIINGA
ncbi:hypothetical protein [Thalassomonas haliotis]|uniref:Uncharacterized protein n=1 Tax=Thalassomonas haliotis TaxID=485448 RepID=A0ABY7VAN4_9GAMM|nr:hypothetical protein [Thalassomonas haliotis]WDE10391.1 hypothetical protein H3N35_19235 [Thalassomonas haliotis]